MIDKIRIECELDRNDELRIDLDRCHNRPRLLFASLIENTLNEGIFLDKPKVKELIKYLQDFIDE